MKALYTAATGMAAQQRRIENISNNLANVSTVGFKKSRENFEDLLYQQMPTSGAGQGTTRASNLEVGSGVRLASMTKDFRSGDLQQTGNPMDVAIVGRGFFVVQSTDGREFYTRNGQFGINANGELVTQMGNLLSPGIDMPSDASSVRIDEDGSLLAIYDGSSTPTVLGTLQVADFINPSGLQSMGGNLYSATPESGQPINIDSQDGFSVRQGFVESSNVDVAEELVNMITAQRAFELTSKAVESADQTMQIVNNLKR
jgi:flagellar basal-body rod protein FlgG